MTAKIPKTGYVEIILLIILIIGAVVYAISVETERVLTEEVRDKLVTVAGITASQIDGVALASLQPGDENSTRFLAIRDKLQQIKQYSKDITNIYTMRRTGETIVFVVDGDYGFKPDSPGIGTVYPDPEPELYRGFSTPIADHSCTTDQWGTVMSGFSPIKTHTGETVGIIGVDIDSTIITNELWYIRTILLLFALIVVFASSMGVVILERRRRSDELKRVENEEKYRFLFERAGVAIFLLEARGPGTGAIITANEAAEKMHGYTHEELCSMKIDDLQPEQDHRIVDELLFKTKNGEWIHHELNHLRKDGTTFPVEESGGLLDLGHTMAVMIISRDITDRKLTSRALEQASKKLNILNAVTFNDIQNITFSMQGYLELEKNVVASKEAEEFREKEEELVRKISRHLEFAKDFQDLGTKPPRWQNVNQTFIIGISHLDFTSIKRTVHLDNLEIFVDPLFEQVFFSLASNIVSHGKKATSLALNYQETDKGLMIIFEDDGVGIATDLKEKIFERGYGTQKGMSLFLVREILGITGITIRETGVEGQGAQFEISVPPGVYRFPK